jgi:hypothetical protein
VGRRQTHLDQSLHAVSGPLGRARWEHVFDSGKDENGERRQITKSSGFLTQREGQDALARAMAEHRGQPASAEAKPMPTFAGFAERMFQEGNRREWPLKTLERSKDLARYAVGLFGDTPPANSRRNSYAST